ncbi:MAG: hypothetical protein NPMRTH1_1510006 [Nitrosopumilales archaeon]|nr:MAG: hypothetical protein NPMRTH1_1510006 [Nitrosopumilales archaeon]
MSEDEQLKVVIEQTISKAIATIPSYLQEIEENKGTLKVLDQKEFVYGLIIGMALSMAVASLTSIKKGIPTPEDQLKIRDMVYSKIPEIRKEIFK